MDYRAYEKALMLGYSEREATRIGEDAFFDNARLLSQQEARGSDRVPIPLCDICGEADAVTTENGYFVCSEKCDHEARNRQPRS